VFYNQMPGRMPGRTRVQEKWGVESRHGNGRTGNVVDQRGQLAVVAGPLASIGTSFSGLRSGTQSMFAFGIFDQMSQGPAVIWSAGLERIITSERVRILSPQGYEDGAADPDAAGGRRRAALEHDCVAIA